jgi:hypothetical protein
MRNKKRCRLHGGKSTGPKTERGKRNAAMANRKLGYYTKESIQERLQIREMLKWAKDL